MLSNIISKIKSAPKNPGVYIFYKKTVPLYIGKASNLKNRLQNYLKVFDYKTEALHKEATDLKLIKLRSNIEALIEESKLIKKLKPQYNILWKDDKNYFYVAITKEKFPRIFITHQPQQLKAKSPARPAGGSKLKANDVGPFTDGRAIKAVLRLLRRYFPYCTCKPHLRLCLNSQINNCPGYCCKRNANIRMHANDTNNTNVKKYQKNIKKIKNILTGKDKKFIRQLKDPYELLVLEKIWAHSPYLANSKAQSPKRTISDSHLAISRMECYDNSHLSGKEAVGAMTAWKRESQGANSKAHWVADKNAWRKFKIRGNYTEDDPRMMEEIVSRRLNHPEWPYPDLIIIDGGITQFRAAERALRNRQLTTNDQQQIKIISFAKPNQLVFGLEKNPVPISNLSQEFQKLIKMAIQNTHNFVIRYHRKIREMRYN